MKGKILAIDDELHMLKLLERVFTEKTSYQITTTNNSLEVPSILEREMFDLVITDLRMPGMDGLDVLNWIKERNRTEEVILITAFGSPEIAGKALAGGAHHYITKPFRKEEILFAADRALACCRMRRDLLRMKKLFRNEPMKTAVREFGREYIHYWAAALDWDIDAVAKRTGLNRDAVQASLEDNGIENT